MQNILREISGNPELELGRNQPKAKAQRVSFGCSNPTSGRARRHKGRVTILMA